jgi:DNA-binding NtrC family response regulator
MMSFQKPHVFIIYKNEDVTSLLAGTFWLKGFEPFKFINGKESLKKFREIDGKVDAVVISLEIALDNDLMLIVNIKRINPNTKILVISEEEESKKTSMYEYGAMK